MVAKKNEGQFIMIRGFQKEVKGFSFEISE